ncbi:MAG: acetylglutamate kinase [Patescibacteria group bacterium]|jgi:acetylglutamate kinase
MNARIKEGLEKIQVVLGTLSYAKAFKNQIMVFKSGGSVIEDPEHEDDLLSDLAVLQILGIKPILVHGGGPEINKLSEERGIVTRKVNGLRYTDQPTLDVVQEVLKKINRRLVSKIYERGGRAWQLYGEDTFTAVKKKMLDESGMPADLGLVGEPIRADINQIEQMLGLNIIPIITPLGYFECGQFCNMNADEVAFFVAKTLKAAKLVFISDVPGLLRVPGDENDEDSVISTLWTDEVEGLIQEGVITGGMRPKIESAVEAINSGVGKGAFD